MWEGYYRGSQEKRTEHQQAPARRITWKVVTTRPWDGLEVGLEEGAMSGGTPGNVRGRFWQEMLDGRAGGRWGLQGEGL